MAREVVKKVYPITPQEVEASREIPALVFEGFNDLIKDNYNRVSSTFGQAVVISRLGVWNDERCYFQS